MLLCCLHLSFHFIVSTETFPCRYTLSHFLNLYMQLEMESQFRYIFDVEYIENRKLSEKFDLFTLVYVGIGSRHKHHYYY